MTGHRASTRFLTVVLLVFATLLAAACGVPTDSHPREIASQASNPLGQVPSATTAANSGTRSVTLYFIREERLAQVDRPVDRPPDLTESLTQLLSGVTARERDQKYSSLIPPDTSLIGTRLRTGVLTVNLSKEFKALIGENYLKAVAQIVYTATAIDGVKSLRFFYEGELASVPTVNAGNIEQVSRANYRNLSP